MHNPAKQVHCCIARLRGACCSVPVSATVVLGCCLAGMDNRGAALSGVCMQGGVDGQAGCALGGLPGRVVLDDAGDGREVQAAGGHIGAEQDPPRAAGKVQKGLRPDRLQQNATITGLRLPTGKFLKDVQALQNCLLWEQVLMGLLSGDSSWRSNHRVVVPLGWVEDAGDKGPHLGQVAVQLPDGAGQQGPAGGVLVSPLQQLVVELHAVAAGHEDHQLAGLRLLPRGPAQHAC